MNQATHPLMKRLPVLIGVMMMPLLTMSAADAQTSDAQLPTAAEHLAHELEHISRSIARNPQAAEDPRTLAVAADLLDRAVALAPEDAERVRLQVELAQMVEDRDAFRSALRRYVALSPRDDRAQLRLIDTLAEGQQTADERLGFYRRIVDSQHAGQFSAALRSRVAHRAAMLAFERGDQKAFRRYLGMALSLDQTNKAAAVDTLNFLESRENLSPARRAAALFTLLVADPTDAQTHAAIADLLLRHGAYADAVLWYEQASALAQAEGRPLSPALAQKGAVSLWATGDVQTALGIIAPALPPLPQAEQPDAEGDEPTDAAADAATPADAADAADAPDAAAEPVVEDEAFQNLVEDLLWLDLLIRAAEGRELAGAIERARQTVRDTSAGAWRVDEAWARFVAGQDLTQIKPLLADADPDASSRAGLLQTVVQGMEASTQQALEELEAQAEESAEAGLALALIQRRLGNEQQALQQLDAVAVDHPASISALSARALLRRAGQAPPTVPAAATVAPVFADTPIDLALLAARPERFVQLTVQAPKLIHQWPEPMVMELVLHNVSPIPLAVGPGGSLPTQVAVQLDARAGNRRFSPPPPIIVDLNRRLRLEPDEKLVIPVRLDAQAVTELAKFAIDRRLEVDVTAVMNPRIGAGGQIRPGLMGVTASRRNFTYRSPDLTEDNVDQWLSRLDADSPTRDQALLVLPPYAFKLRESSPELANTIVRALAERVGRWSTVERSAVLTAIPTAPAAIEQMGPVIESLTSGDAVLPKLVYLARQAPQRDDPILQQALASDDLTLRQMAELTVQVIRQAEQQDQQQQP